MYWHIEDTCINIRGRYTATHCSTLQHTATHRKTLQHTATHCNTLQHTATHCNTLQHTTRGYKYEYSSEICMTVSTENAINVCMLYMCAYLQKCATLQHAATRCNTLQQITTDYNALERVRVMHTCVHACSSIHVCISIEACLQARIQKDWVRDALQHTATHCNTLQHTATHCNAEACLRALIQGDFTNNTEVVQTMTVLLASSEASLRRYIAATHCNTLQHTATHCNTLQHTATPCNTLQHTATHCNTPQHTAAHCNTLQHTATQWSLNLRIKWIYSHILYT